MKDGIRKDGGFEGGTREDVDSSKRFTVATEHAGAQPGDTVPRDTKVRLGRLLRKF